MPLNLSTITDRYINLCLYHVYLLRMSEYQWYGHMPTSPNRSSEAYINLPESLYRSPHVSNGVHSNMVNRPYRGMSDMTSQYGGMPSINWTPHEHPRFDLSPISYMTGREDMIGSANTNIRRHEICITVPTHQEHAKSRECGG